MTNTTKSGLSQEDKKAWVAALRSGEYKQGAQFLCSKDKYCCLGVLAEIKDLWESATPVEPATDFLPDFILPLEDFLPDFILPLETQKLLAVKNDVDGKTFDEIADWIEDNL